MRDAAMVPFLKVGNSNGEMAPKGRHFLQDEEMTRSMNDSLAGWHQVRKFIWPHHLSESKNNQIHVDDGC